MKPEETNKEEEQRLQKERDTLAALLQKWPYEKRMADLLGYSAALREWRDSCGYQER